MGGTHRSHTAVVLSLATIVIAACAGCTSSPRESVGYRTHFGQQAIELARHVPACSEISAPGGFSSRYWSVAVCWIDQRQVNFYSFTSAAAAAAPETVHTPRAFARGSTWEADVNAASLSKQQHILTFVARALDGKVSVER